MTVAMTQPHLSKPRTDDIGMVVAKIEFKRTGAPAKHVLVKEGMLGVLRNNLRMITEEFEAKLASHDTVTFERLEMGGNVGTFSQTPSFVRRGMTVIVSNSVESSDLFIVPD